MAIILIPSFLAIFYGLVSLSLYLYKPRNILSAFLIFSLLFGVAEFIRGSILTGFPWNLIIYSFSKNLNFLSVISLIGTYSLNLITITLFTTCTLLLKKIQKRGPNMYYSFIFAYLFFFYGIFQKKEFSIKKLNQNLIRSELLVLILV